MNELLKLLITPISTGALVFTLFIFFKKFILAYYTEKAKNLANKEDIEELTDKVQKITSLYTQKNNQIEQKLSHLLSIQSSHRNEERVAIIEFYESYMHWMYTILEIPIDQYNSNTLDKLIDKKLELDTYFVSINKSSAKMLLLVKNESLLNIHREMISELINFKSWTERKLWSVQFNLEKWNSISSRFSRIIENLENNMAQAEIIAKEEVEIQKMLEESLHVYKSGKVSEFRKCGSVK